MNQLHVQSKIKEKHNHAITTTILDNIPNAHYRRHQNWTNDTLSENSSFIEVITRASNTSSKKRSKINNYTTPTRHPNKAVLRIVEVQIVSSIKTSDDLFSNIDTVILNLNHNDDNTAQNNIPETNHATVETRKWLSIMM